MTVTGTCAVLITQSVHCKAPYLIKWIVVHNALSGCHILVIKKALYVERYLTSPHNTFRYINNFLKTLICVLVIVFGLSECVPQCN